MAYIGRQLARGENKLFDDISSSFNGSTTVFNLTVSSVATSTATPYQLFVSLGGVMQKPNTDFTTAGNQITFTTAPAAGLSCWIMMQGDTIDQAAIPDASVTPSKISGSNFAFSGDLRLKDADGSHYVGFASPTTVASNVVWTLPAADSSGSKFLKSNGSGVLSWDTPATIGGATGVDFNDNVKARFGTGNDLEIFHNASNSVINDAGTGDLLLQVGGSTKATVSSTGFGVTGALTVSTNATISGNLTVSGTTTTVDSVTLSVKDKNIEMGVVSSPSDTTADGGGITLKGATDKTFNWVDSTDAWTSSEHIHLPDNKKLLLGTSSDLQIHHSGSNNYIDDATPFGLFIRTAGTENAIAVVPNGAVELFHNNVKKIETTSGGINVTGAIQVNGAALSSEPEITATASGAVTAGDRLIINTNGTTSPVSSTFTALSNPTGTAEQLVTTQGVDPTSRHIAYDPDNKRFLMVMRMANGSNADKIEIRAGTVTSAGVFTLGAAATTLSNLTNNSYPTCCYAGNGRFVVMYRDNGNSGRPGGRIVTVASDLTFSVGSNSELDGAGMMSTPACEYDPDNDKVLLMWNDNSSVHLHVKSFTCSGGSFSSASSKVTIENSYTRQLLGGQGTGSWIAHDPDTERMIVMYRTGNSDATLNAYRARVIQLSGTNITVGSSQTVATGTQGYLNWGYGVTYDTGANKLGFGYQFENNVVYARTGTVTGGSTNTISFGTGLTVLSEDAEYFPISATGHSALAMFIRKASDNGHGYLVGLDIVGTSLSASNFTEVVSSNEAKFHDTILTENGQVVAMYYHGSGDTKLITGNVSSETTTAERYVGIANNTASNGNSVTIRTFGATNDNQSSLTVGSLHFIQKNGSLSTTADDPRVEAGVALSATKILIKG